MSASGLLQVPWRGCAWDRRAHMHWKDRHAHMHRKDSEVWACTLGANQSLGAFRSQGSFDVKRGCKARQGWTNLEG